MDENAKLLGKALLAGGAVALGSSLFAGESPKRASLEEEAAQANIPWYTIGMNGDSVKTDKMPTLRKVTGVEINPGETIGVACNIYGVDTGHIVGAKACAVTPQESVGDDSYTFFYNGKDMGTVTIPDSYSNMSWKDSEAHRLKELAKKPLIKDLDKKFELDYVVCNRNTVQDGERTPEGLDSIIVRNRVNTEFGQIEERSANAGYADSCKVGLRDKSKAHVSAAKPKPQTPRGNVYVTSLDDICDNGTDKVIWDGKSDMAQVSYNGGGLREVPVRQVLYQIADGLGKVEAEDYEDKVGQYFGKTQLSNHYKDTADLVERIALHENLSSDDLLKLQLELTQTKFLTDLVKSGADYNAVSAKLRDKDSALEMASGRILTFSESWNSFRDTNRGRNHRNYRANSEAVDKIYGMLTVGQGHYARNGMTQSSMDSVEDILFDGWHGLILGGNK